MDEPIVDFRNPPVTEVVCGIAFQQPQNYSTPHMGLFWNKVHEDFPVVEIKPPLMSLDTGLPFGAFDVLPTPRYFFRSKDKRELIQLQVDRFLYNWLKTGDAHKYPRYRHIIKKFHKYRRQFEQFLQENEFGKPKIRELRLTYVNHIPFGEGWNNLYDIGKIFPEFKIKKRRRRYLGAPTTVNYTTHFPVRDINSHLEVSIRDGRKKITSNEDQQVYVFQLTVIGNIIEPSLGELRAWFDMAREAIDKSFLDLTNSKMHREVWGIHERR